MADTDRRWFVAAGLALPSIGLMRDGHAQSSPGAGLALLKLVPWQLVLTALGLGFTVYDHIPKQGGSSQSTICNFSKENAADLARKCLEVGLALSADDNGVAESHGWTGVVPALSRYVEKPSQARWETVRINVLNFLNATTDFIRESERDGGILALVDDQTKKAAIPAFAAALRALPRSMLEIQSEPRGRYVEEVAAAKYLLEMLSNYPGYAVKALAASEELKDRRLDANCP